MRKIIISLIVLGLISIIFFVLKKGLDMKKKDTNLTRKINEDIQNKMPLFEFKTLKEEVYSKYDLIKNEATIIVYFDPDCNLCEKSGIIFNKFKSLHEKSNILFVSSSSKEKIKEYQKKFKLENIPNIIFLQSEEDLFYDFFKEINTPTYLIYNKNQKLLKVINDDVPTKIILRYIKAAQIEK